MKIKILFALLIVTTIVLECVNVFFSNTVAGSSIEVATIRQDIQMIDEKNMSLRSELLSYSSFERIASRAAELGFVENKNAISLTAPLPVAVSR